MAKKPYRILWISLCLALAAGCSHLSSDARKAVALFDGKSFNGWDGDTISTWRIEDGQIVGGSLIRTVPRNEFVATERRFTNFVLRLQVKLLGTEGFVNAGIQVRSERTSNPPNEMVGYQCDVGEGWWGAIYDESRRNRVLIRPDPAIARGAVLKGEWNRYEIRCEGRRVRSWINGVAMVDYTEPDESLPQHGRIGLQVHGGGKAEVRYKHIWIEELP